MTFSLPPFVLIALGILGFGVVLYGLVVLVRDRRRHAEREAALYHVARTLSGAVSVQEVAQQAVKYALASTRALSAHVERARDGVVEVMAAAGERAPSVGGQVKYPDSFASSVAGATEPVIRMTAGVVGRSAPAYLHSCYGCSGLVVPLAVEEGPQSAEGALVLLLDTKRGNMPRTETAYARALGDLVTAAMRRTLLVEREHLARTEAETAVRDREQVLRVVSHDLKNPLHTIGMVAQLLLDLPLSDGERKKQLEILRRTVDRMKRLVRDLLDATRVQSGHGIPLVAEPVDVVPLIADAIEPFRDQAAGNGQRLLGEVTEGVPPVLADRDRLLQVFSNLIGNGLKFTPEGGRVRIRAEAEGETSVRFSVIDTGPGIPAESLPHLFELFWQARDRRASLGTGLGLSIARGIVESHGGRISVESTPGEGSTFTFTVPVAPEAPHGCEDANR